MSVNFKIRPIFLALFLFVFLFAVACAEGIDPNQNTTANGEINNGGGNGGAGDTGNGDGGVKPETPGDPSNPGGGEEVIPPVDGGSGEGGGNGDGDKDPTVPPTPAPDPEEPEVAEDTVGVTHDNLTGGYKIVYFYSDIKNKFQPMILDTKNPSMIQGFKGEADIYFTDGTDGSKNINIKTKIKFKSKKLDDLASLAGDQSNQFSVYAPIDATIIDNTTIGNFNKSSYPYTTDNYDLKVAKDGKVIVRQNLSKDQQAPVVGKVTATVYAVVHLVKISNTPFALQASPNYLDFTPSVEDPDVIPVIPAPKPPEPDKPSDFEPIDAVLWTGTYDLAEIRFNDGTNSYSSAYYTENTSDANFSSDVLDYVGKASIYVTADSKLKVVTKYQIETQTINSIPEYKYDEFPLIDAVQNKRSGVIGRYSEFDDNVSNFNLTFDNDTKLYHIVKKVDKVTYEYMFKKVALFAEALTDEKFWKLTESILEGDGVLGYYRIVGLANTGQAWNAHKNVPGNILIYVDPEETAKNGGKKTVRFKMKWKGIDIKLAPGPNALGLEASYDKQYAASAGLKTIFKDMLGKKLGFITNPFAYIEPTKNTCAITFDGLNLNNTPRNFELNGDMLRLELVKLYDASSGKKFYDKKFY